MADVKEVRQKIKNKSEINATEMSDMDIFGNRLKIPAHIQKELDSKGLVPRFVSIRTMSEAGGSHPKGWVPYAVEKPEENPITGTTDKYYKVGDLILAVKTKEQHAMHKSALAKRSSAQSQQHKKNVQEMRDRIKDSRADKHIALIEGYEENGDEE